MFRRDFSKPNKEYFKKNAIVLTSVAIFLFVGILIASIFGLNKNFEMGGYYTFEISMQGKASSEYSKSITEIGNVVNKYNGEFDTVLISGEGDNTVFVVRYLNKISASDVDKLNIEVASKLGIDVDKVYEHNFVKPSVKTRDYVFTIATILLIIALTSVFALFRYNSASAIAIILSCTIGTLGFVSFTSIFRMSVGMSYLGMLIILNTLIIYFAIDIFENINKSAYFANQDYALAIENSIKSVKTRVCIVSIAVLILGALLVIAGTASLRYVSQNIMFMVVTLLAVVLYVVPFVWNVCITRGRKKSVKVESIDKK